VKILHLIVGLGNGGAENTLLKVCSSKNKFSHEVISLTKNNQLFSNFKEKGIKVNFLNFKKGNLNIYQFYKFFRIINLIKPKYICSWMYHACFFSVLINFFFKKKKIIWLIRHGNFNKKYSSKTTIILKNVIKLFSNIPKAILYCSKFSRKTHKKSGFYNLNSEIIYNGVDVVKFNYNSSMREKLRKKLNIPKNYFVIGVVGRNNPQKNHIQLFRILKRNKLNKLNIAVVLIGKDVKKFKSTLQFNNKNHKFIFLKETKNIHNYYSVFDLNLSLSTYGESFPNILIEGMSCQIPTIASNIADNKFIIKNKDMIFNPNDDEDLINKIISIFKINQKKLITLKKTLRKNIILNYSLKQMEKNYEIFFDRIFN
tara:strand:- start:1856 stop:2965 length:1110 start_codon:yes stop_codon:yes gene_type:complete